MSHFYRIDTNSIKIYSFYRGVIRYLRPSFRTQDTAGYCLDRDIYDWI